MKKRYVVLSLFVILEVSFGFLRDFIFTNINAQRYKIFYEDASIQVDEWMQFTENFSYMGLYYLKWGLTFLFSLLFLGLALMVINYLFQNKKYQKVTILSYLVLFIIAGISIGLAFLSPSIEEEGFAFSRYLMHMAQSPIVLMILIPAFYLAEYSPE